ncbi:MAG TPA: aspartate dehydrogenase [Nitrososphaeraceae archaeon]
MKAIGIIGCGAIGIQVAKAIDEGRINNTAIAFLFDADKSAIKGLAAKLTAKNHTACFSDFTDLISSPEFKKSNLVLECASQDAVRLFARRLLESGKDMIIMSVGALTDNALLLDLIDLSVRNGTSLVLPTGAIAGIDAIRSAREGLESVMLITTKTPKALEGAPFFKKNTIRLDAINKKTTIFNGTAAEAVLNFPANVNVASILALAGLGMQKTIVRIVVDPKIHYNQHEIIAEGKFGKLNIKLKNNQAKGNPKTSFLAILSAIETVRAASNRSLRIGT